MYKVEPPLGGARRPTAFRPLAVLLAALAVVAPSARADWPASRHDAARTGTGDRPSAMVKPAIAWKHYLGGSVGGLQFFTHDTNADGAAEVLYIASGALIAKKPNDQVVWKSTPLDLIRIEGAFDFDGNGKLEILASAVVSLHVIDGQDGRVLWSIPTGHVGNPGAVRVADFDRDGKLDVYVADTGCGTLPSLNDAGSAWSFAGGYAAARLLFQLERGKRDYACGLNDAIADVNGDGQLDVVAQGTSYFYVYSGVDGSLISTSESVGYIPYGEGLIEVADVDGDAARELVAYADTNYAPPLNSRRVFLLDWDVTTNRLVRRWERAVSDVSQDRHRFGVGGVGDLGGDGALDVVTSFYSAASDTWSTLVLDARTGVERTSVARGPFRGLADLDGDSRPEVVTGDRTSGTSVYKWTSGSLSLWYRASRFEPLVVVGRDAAAPSSMITKLLAFDLNHTTPAELLGLSFGADGTTPEAIVALEGAANVPRELARRSFDNAVSVVAARSASPITASYAQLIITRNDGYLWILDDTLTPTNALREGFPLNGVQVGTYYSGPKGIGRAPVAGDLDGNGTSEVVVVDGRDVIVALEAANATSTRGPRVQWQIPGAKTPALIDLDNDRKYEVAYWTTASAAASVRVVRGTDTTAVWQRSLGSFDVVPINDLMIGDVSGDKQADLVYTLLSSTDGTLRINALRGITGSRVWANDFSAVVAGSGYGAGSLFDRENDGALDILASQSNLLQWVAGPTGAAGPKVIADYADFGLIANLDDDPANEILGSGALLGVNSFEMDLTPRWKAPDTQQLRINGGLVRCGDAGVVFISGHDASPRLSTWNAKDGSITKNLVLAGGVASKFGDPVPPNAGHVGTVTLSKDLTGNGKIAALVPSSDGYLYAVDPCDLSLVWALKLGAPVGEAILADTDGDQQDEIVVTVGDGFIYGIDREQFPATKGVYENAGSGPANADSDVDQLRTTSVIYANWDAVEGATRYEYAILGADGKFVTKPDFVDVGTSTSVTASDLPLQAGFRYVVAVRATGASGVSVETLSDGVTVLDEPCAACGTGTICENDLCVPMDGVHEEDASVDDDAGTEGSCAACGKGTTCKDGICVAKGKSGGCCSVAGGGSSRLAPYLATLFLAVVGLRLRRRKY